MATAGVTGSLFYELHPQVWGKGLMTEAFERVLTFAMEEIGCNKVIVSPRLSACSLGRSLKYKLGRLTKLSVIP